jgi:hypothetical protein
VVVVVQRLARALLAEFTISSHSFATPANKLSLEESESDVDTSN